MLHPLRTRTLARRLRCFAASWFAASVLVVAVPEASAKGSIRDLVHKLDKGVDFRVRVQAALELGKSKNGRARGALERALDDDNAAVRAAAAAALKVLGDDAAIAALKAHAKDSSPAVRSQIASSIKALEAAKAAREEKPEVLVELGKIRNGGRVRSSGVDADVQRASREKIDQLPGVDLVDEKAARRSKKPRKKGEPPIVKVTGRVKKLEHQKQGESVIYSASVEFVLHQMPGEAIKSVISGSARARGDASGMTDRAVMDDLRRSAIEAAIESAMQNAPEAIRAAMR